MFKVKRLFAAAAALLCACVLSLPHAHAVSAGGAILIEAESGRALFETGADRRLPMASTTKIMTALIVLENVPLEETVTVSAAAAATEGSSIYLKAGEELTVEDLLYGLMLCSGNDAANALAEHVAGSLREFAVLMNEKAKELGMENSSFVTPSGLDDKGHYSTARDMAKLMRAAMQNEKFCEITGTKTITRGTRYFVNHNRLLSLYSYSIGGKTGYTSASGRCLVSAAKKDGVTLIAVTLDDGNDWNDHIELYKSGFERARKVLLCSAEDVYELPAVGSGGVFARVAPSGELWAVLIDRDASDIEVTVELPRFVYAPVKTGDEVGKIIFKDTNGEKWEAELVAIRDVPAHQPPKASLLDKIGSLFAKIIGG